MQIISTDFQDLYIIEPTILTDDRGFFYENFNQKIFLEKTGIDVDFVQENFSKSKYWTIRGLHFQTWEFTQSKFITCLEGKILDIALDLREGSPTFGKIFSIELSSENKKSIFIPRGFAHWFATLSENAIISYKCDNFYNKNSESWIIFDDEDLAIDWQIPQEKIILSEKDKILPSFKKFLENIWNL